MGAWYSYPRIDNFGKYPDPEGAFPKPDSNILVPSGTVFTSLFPGVVTGVDTSSSYGQVVTIKLNAPINSAATHIAYLHMTTIAPGLKVGSKVNAGTPIGIGGGNISTSGAMPGIALTSSDVYGHGSGWADNVKGTWINPLLNPVPVLNAAKAGTLGNLGGASSTPAASTGCQPPSSALDIGGAFQYLACESVSFGEHIAVFVVALLLIIIGFYLLDQKAVDSAGKAIGGVAAKVAMA